jgi:hypothetical protein
MQRAALLRPRAQPSPIAAASAAFSDVAAESAAFDLFAAVAADQLRAVVERDRAAGAE